MGDTKKDQSKSLQQAMNKAFHGERTEPRAKFRQAVHNDPNNYKAWLWLAYTAETDDEKRAALYRAYQLNSQNQKIRDEFQRMHTTQHIQLSAQRGAFLCYSRADELFAVELAEQIKRRSLPVWIDMFDIPPHTDWREAIHHALDDNGVMLLVLSPSLIEDADSRQELEYFLAQGKVVIPLMYRQCDPRELNLMHPIIDFRQNPQTGLRLVYALLGIHRGESASGV